MRSSSPAPEVMSVEASTSKRALPPAPKNTRKRKSASKVRRDSPSPTEPTPPSQVVPVSPGHNNDSLMGVMLQVQQSLDQMRHTNELEQARAASRLAALEAAVFRSGETPAIPPSQPVLPAPSPPAQVVSPPPPEQPAPILAPVDGSVGTLITAAIPVGGHLKPSIRAQIASGAFVEFASLLPEAEEPTLATVTIDQTGFQRVVSVVGGQQRQKKALSFGDWCAAWNIFVAVKALHEPALTPFVGKALSTSAGPSSRGLGLGLL